MAKGRAKISSSGKGDLDSLALPQPRSLRSRKRECPSDEVFLTDDVRASDHQQDTEGNNRAAAASPLQRPQSLLQESMTSSQQDQAAEQQQDASTEEKHDSQLESFRVHTENDTSKKGKDKEEITAEECNKLASQTCTDKLQVFLPTSEEADESCGTALEEQLGATENSHCDLERNQETSQDVRMVDVKEITKEEIAGLPVKKKPRMGMCGLTERERSHFPQTQKLENGQNRLERVERQMCHNKAELSAQEEIISSPPPIPAASVAELREAEIKLQSSHCEGIDRAETEVHVTVSTSYGTSTVCDPGCSDGKSCEAEPAEKEEAHLGNPEQQELEGSTAEIMAEIYQKQTEDGEDESAEVATSYANPSQNEETEKQKDGSEAAPLQVCSVTITRNGTKEEMTGDAGDGDRAKAGASSTDTQQEGFNCGSLELCRAAETPGSSEREGSCDPEHATSPTMNVEDPQTRDTTDPFGPGCLDYVSDSQLNTIVWIEEEVMDKDGDLGSSHCNEDATDLICGLIRELSSLNRTVMATHRELENLRRGSKSSRSSAR
ncbi:uncharacterized protein LOC121909082 [Thunnus maccoyii]|uniref:uncharacterized protein LOC121909082 n=1 Tax=Thunnus maccoyii TaxID=8240 RepID=UPI001C4A85DA|nr:uncharacterized protein LOC121909082 [Thunnus maccoyii]XP_042285419.1 uncharacterized protein LOC121909082 [Thunnus maccoyii]XP_042285427.1 uncharacterized protein LOC121909082 [Thunnus maccoyii]XP_042285437.1 uncharacterized protein LOC121909082 [Thunnus maccoyii]